MSTHSIWWSQINGGQQPSCSLGGTSSLPHGVAPPINLPTHSSQATVLWIRERQPSTLASNKSFFSTCGMVFIQQFLTSGAKTRERLTGPSGPGLVPWLSCPASLGPRLLNWPHISTDCGSQTLLPCQLSHPSLASLPLPSTWPTSLLRLGKCHPYWGCLLSLSRSGKW
jgi:hypothetical protein